MALYLKGISQAISQAEPAGSKGIRGLSKRGKDKLEKRRKFNTEGICSPIHYIFMQDDIAKTPTDSRFVQGDIAKTPTNSRFVQGDVAIGKNDIVISIKEWKYDENIDNSTQSNRKCNILYPEFDRFAWS